MQRFERSREPPPAVFASPQADRNRRILRDFLLSDARKRAQSSVPRTVLPLEETSVADALGRLFRGKCAFCEARVETRPHRFRPPGEARPHVRSDAGHLYYIWLADAWENIYPICRTCGDQEPDYFPVRDRRAPLPTAEQLNRFVDEGIGLWRGHPPQERPLLLDPCGRGEVYGDIHVELSGRLSPRSQTGFETIQQFNLNHRDRVQARGYVYGERLERLISFLTEPHRSDQTIENLFAFDELEFGGTWFLFLRRLVLATRRPGERRPVASKSGIARHLLQLYGMADASQRLRTAVDQLLEEDTHEPVRPEPPRGRTSRARLIHVAIDNFKSLERIDLVMPKLRAPGEGKVTVPVPSVLVLGENSAGKSSLLEAIALALADPEARAAIDLAVDRLPLNPELMGAKPHQPRRVAKIVLRFDDTRTHSLVIDDGRYSDMGQLTASMPPVFAYGAFRHYADRQRRHSAGRYVKSLFGGDSLLSNPERWLLRLDEDRFDMVVRALRDILSVEGEFEVIRRDFQESRCVIVTRMPAPDGGYVDVETPLAIASSGFRSVLAMVCDVFQGLMDDRVHEEFETLTSARAVVLIDEVEAHLHPRWKMQIMRGLRSALPGITFIATTHDPLCLRGMDDGEVRVMQKVPGDQVAGTRLPVFVEQLRDLPLMSQLTLEQLLTSDLFQMYSTDAPEADERLAAIADLLTRQRAGEILAPTDQEVLTQFDADIAAALPVGSSEVHRLVQDAVAIYLRERRAASQTRMNELRTAARDKIVAVLRDV